MVSTRNAIFLQEIFNVELEVAKQAGQQFKLKIINLPKDTTMYSL